MTLDVTIEDIVAARGSLRYYISQAITVWSGSLRLDAFYLDAPFRAKII